MNYALLNLNDEIKVNLEGIGLIPLVSYYPEVWGLYIKRLNLNQEYLIEVLKGLKKKPNKSDILLNKIDLINNQIKNITSFYGQIPVLKLSEIDNDYLCKSLKTGDLLYVDKRIFNSHVVSEFEAKKYLNIEKKLERRKI